VTGVERLSIDEKWMCETLLHLLATPSPTGRTDGIMQYLGETLTELRIPFELTRRGALLATLRGRRAQPARAVVVHADTIGMSVRRIKPDGRCNQRRSARTAPGSPRARGSPSSPTTRSCPIRARCCR